MSTDLQLIIISILLVLLPVIATRNFFVSVLVITSFLPVAIPVIYGLKTWSILIAGISIMLLAAVIFIVKRKHVFKYDRDIEIKWWRVISRPLAMLFIVFREFIGERFLMYFMGIVAIIFISADLYRLFSKKSLSALYKKSEAQKFSSMTAFLVAIFIVFLLFNADVAYLCLGFIIFGDVAGKLIGIRFGRIRIIHNRTLEGTLAFLTGALFAGFIITSIFNIPFLYLIIGAFVATLTELFSFNLDDNFTVGIVTGGCLEALMYFQVI